MTSALDLLAKFKSTTPIEPLAPAKPAQVVPAKPVVTSAQLLAKFKLPDTELIDTGLVETPKITAAEIEKVVGQVMTPTVLTTPTAVLNERIAAALNLKLPAVATTIPELAPLAGTDHNQRRVEKHEIQYTDLNLEQRQAVDNATSGNSFCLIGSAGTGKSTTQRIVLESLVNSGHIRPMPKADSYRHKHLPLGCMSIAICSLMNKAVNNIRNLLPDNVKVNALTIHKLLEYAPELVDVKELNEHGEMVTVQKKHFVPGRDRNNQIHGLTHIIIEEASTVSLELFALLVDALPKFGRGITFIFLGDLKQLPPVFGQSILTAKLRELPWVELTQVYRQALDSPIKRLAIDINEGKPISDVILKQEYHEAGVLDIYNISGIRPDGKKVPRIDGERQVHSMANHFINLLAKEEFVPFRDVLLCPHRVNRRDDINCDHLNQILAQAEGIRRGAEIFEVLSNRFKKYLAVGDPVMYKKEEYEIINIAPNPSYKGLPAKMPHTALNRWGIYESDELITLDLDDVADDVDTIMNIVVSASDEEEEATARAASHVVTLRYITTDPSQEKLTDISSSGDINEIEFAYCLTVHKSIGSEWDKVFLIAHHSMIRMLTRELLYTASTRAKNYLAIFYDGQNHAKKELHSSTINKAILSPAIKGVTIPEKLDWLEKQEAIKNEDTSNLMDKFKVG